MKKIKTRILNNIMLRNGTKKGEIAVSYDIRK